MTNEYELGTLKIFLNIFLVISLITLCVTSGGWTIFVLWPFFIVLHLVLLIRINLIFRKLSKAQINVIPLYKKSIVTGIILLILTALFNSIDCGDSTGPNTRILVMIYSCGTSIPYILNEVFSFFSLVLLTSYFMFIHMAFENNFTKLFQNFGSSVSLRLYKVSMIIIILMPASLTIYDSMADYIIDHRQPAEGEVIIYSNSRMDSN